jgi:hypothetical protein
MCCCLWFVTCGCCSHLVGVHQWDIKYLHYLLFVFYHGCYVWCIFLFLLVFPPFCLCVSCECKWCIVSLFWGTTWQPLNSKKNYVFQNILFLCFYLLFCLCVVFFFVSMKFFLMLKYFCSCIYLYHHFFCILHHFKSEWLAIAHYTLHIILVNVCNYFPFVHFPSF